MMVCISGKLVGEVVKCGICLFKIFFIRRVLLNVFFFCKILGDSSSFM